MSNALEDQLTSGCCSPARKLATAVAQACPGAIERFGYKRLTAACYSFLRRMELLAGFPMAGDDPSEENHCPHCEQEVHDAS